MEAPTIAIRWIADKEGSVKQIAMRAAGAKTKCRSTNLGRRLLRSDVVGEIRLESHEIRGTKSSGGAVRSERRSDLTLSNCTSDMRVVYRRAVRTAQMDADTGLTTAASVVITTKHGIDEWHGDAAFYERTGALNARFPVDNPAPNPKQTFSRNKYIGTTALTTAVVNGVSTNLDSLRGPPYIQAHLPVSRPFYFREGWSFTPFIEFLNLFNRNNPGANNVTNVAALPVPQLQVQAGNITNICTNQLARRRNQSRASINCV